MGIIDDSNGYGSRDGSGYGDGDGSGYGDGYGDRYGYGYGYGDGYGRGYGGGDGSGYGDGYGDGDGGGDGDKYGYGNRKKVNNVSFTPHQFYTFFMQKYNLKNIMQIENVEQRAVVIKHYGFENILKEIESKKLDSFREYELYQLDFDSNIKLNILKMKCQSTNREFYIGIPAEIVSVKDALIWIQQGEYKFEDES